MILYFSGTGNSEHAAEKIGQIIGDEVVNLFDRIKAKDYSPMTSDKPWVIAVPTYAWQIPHIIRDWLLYTELKGSKEAYFVMTCGESIGNAGKYLEALCQRKGLAYKGCAKIIMPENYIALFDAPDKETANRIIRTADRSIKRTADVIKTGENLPKERITLKDKFLSGPVNLFYYPFMVSARKFHTTKACIGCGKCEKLCPLSNVKMKKGKPKWGSKCTHCMACICSCPVEAIEYGRKSVGKVRYTFPKEK